MKTVFCVIALASAVLLLSPVAHAAGPDNPRMACRDDAQKFCKDIQPGGGRIKDCLEEHYKEISDACYAVLKNAPSGPPPQEGHTDPGPPPPDDTNDAPAGKQ